MAFQRNSKPAINMLDYLRGEAVPKAERGEFIEIPLDENDYSRGYDYRGFFCLLDKALAHWRIDPERSTVSVPETLFGTYTNRDTMKRCIDGYLDNGKG